MSDAQSVVTTPEEDPSRIVGFNGITAEHISELGIATTALTWQPSSRPVSFSTKLTRKSNYFIVPVSGAFYYIKIAAPVEVKPGLYTWNPPVDKILHEGFVVLEKKLIYVTLGDLDRKLIRTSREIVLKKGAVFYEDFVNGTFGPRVPTREERIRVNQELSEAVLIDESSSASAASQSYNLGPTPGIVSLEELAAIDLAMQNQEQQLLYSQFEEA